MRRDILVFGHGWIGSKLSDHFNCNYTVRRIETYEDVQKEIDIHNPKIIINAIGSFGRNVDDCEINKTKTLFAHTFVPLLLAEAAIRNNIKLVHISSGCLFHFDYDKDEPITEEREPDFFDLYYCRNKISTEAALTMMSNKCNILQVRPRIPIDSYEHPRNLLTKLLKFDTVINIKNSVVYIPDFVRMVEHLIKIDAKGIYNTVNSGYMEYVPFLTKYYKKAGIDKEIKVLNDQPIVRTNLIMNTDKIAKSGFKPADIRDRYEDIINSYIFLSNLTMEGI